MFGSCVHYIRSQPFFCFSLVKREPTWPRSGELVCKENVLLCVEVCTLIEEPTMRRLLMATVARCRCLQANRRPPYRQGQECVSVNTSTLVYNWVILNERGSHVRAVSRQGIHCAGNKETSKERKRRYWRVQLSTNESQTCVNDLQLWTCQTRPVGDDRPAWRIDPPCSSLVASPCSPVVNPRFARLCGLLWNQNSSSSNSSSSSSSSSSRSTSNKTKVQ